MNALTLILEQPNTPVRAALRPLTVVVCLDYANVTGGLEKVAIDSAIGLKRAGHHPILFTASGPVAPSLIAAGVEVVCLDQSDLRSNSSKALAALQGIWNVEAGRALETLLKAQPHGETIVHVHGWARALSPSIASAIRAAGHHAVHTLHDYFLICPNGGFYNYQSNQTCTLKPLSAACWASHCDQKSYPRKLWRNARLTIAQKAAHLPDVFQRYITISQFQRAIVQPYLPDGVPVDDLSNPIEVENLGPKINPASGDLIFVGRLSPEKGPLLFAEAARRAGITPVFVGDGPMADELRAKFPEARLLGWQKPEDARAAIRDARALVFPSLWYEGQPLTVLEAKALGTPVIVSDNCAGREEIIDGRNGLWFRSNNVDDLARALKQAGDDALIAAMSRAAHADYWAAPRTLDVHIEKLLTIYRNTFEMRA